MGKEVILKEILDKRKMLRNEGQEYVQSVDEGNIGLKSVGLKFQLMALCYTLK